MPHIISSPNIIFSQLYSQNRARKNKSKNPIKHNIYYRELYLLIFYCPKFTKKCPRTDAPGHSLEYRLLIRLQAQHFFRKEPTTI